MPDIAISVRNVSKCYQVFDNQRSRILHAIWPKHTQGSQEIWALKNINFEIKRGESVAIIGRNGGGKSTLLEILTRTLTPTTGEVEIKGRVSALLELGSGFNPEYSGRDNVILNGLLLGLKRDEILSRFDEIESFAEIGAAIDRPVKTYSSGMVMRLAFAVQVLCDPQILIVDEALSVGDFFFQQKCFAHIRKMQQDGVTLLFVSHDMKTVRDLCTKALYLVRGETVHWGDSKDAIRIYLAEGKAVTTVQEKNLPKISKETTSLGIPDFASAMRDSIWNRGSDLLQWGNTNRLLAVTLKDQTGIPTSSIRMGETVIVEVFFRTLPYDKCHLSLTIKNQFDQIITNTGTYLLGLPMFGVECLTYHTASFEIQWNAEAGQYSFMLKLGKNTSPNCGDLLDSTSWLGPIHITWDYEKCRAPFLGMFGFPVKLKILKLDIKNQREAHK
jgi:lipopolysaccharide transport system ATP-binding protein